jgi:hypothetical protein
MSQQFLLPCSCGQKTRITTAQAGAQVKCVCGQSLSVPTLRGIRKLEVAPFEAASKRSATWSPIHGALFASGLAIASIGVVVLAFFGLRYVQLGASGYTRDITDAVVKAERERIDRLAPTEALAEWKENVNDGLGQREEPPWVRANKIMAGYKSFIRASVAALVAGALLSVVALLLPRGSAA